MFCSVLTEIGLEFKMFTIDARMLGAIMYGCSYSLFAPVIYLVINRLVGLVVKAFASRAVDPGFDSRHTSDVRIGTPVATRPGAWCFRVSAGTGRTGVSIL